MRALGQRLMFLPAAPLNPHTCVDPISRQREAGVDDGPLQQVMAHYMHVVAACLLVAGLAADVLGPLLDAPSAGGLEALEGQWQVPPGRPDEAADGHVVRLAQQVLLDLLPDVLDLRIVRHQRCHPEGLQRAVQVCA